MQVVVRSAGVEQDLDVEPRPDATLGDLARAVRLGAAPAGGEVAVDGRRLPAATLLSEAGLVEGALVDLDAASAFLPAPPRGLPELVVVAGSGAGRTWPLPRPLVLGRDGACDVVLADPTVSRQHCTLGLGAGGLVVTDVRATNSTVVDDRPLRPGETYAAAPDAVVRLGPYDLAVRPRRADDRPRGLDVRRQAGPAGTVAFNRPPRPAQPPAPPPLRLPEPPPEHTATPFSVAALLGPLVLAGVMVAVTGDPRFALFSALSPLLAVGTWYESRRRTGRARRRDARRWCSDLDELAERVRAAGTAERARLREVAPDPAEVLRRAALPSTRLWARRPHAPDFLRLYAGCADLPWRPPVDDPRGTPVPPEVAAVLSAAVVVAGPAVVDLSGGGVVGVVGDRDVALGVARGLLCAAAVGQGPADVTVGVFVDPGREPDWDWCKWLPHTRAAGAGRQRWLSGHRPTSDAALRALAAGAGSGTALVVLDSDVLTVGQGAPARELLDLARRRGADPAPRPVAGIVVAASEDRLPAACDQVLAVRADGSAVLTRLADGERLDLLTAGLPVELARRCARDLARFEDPELAVAGAGLPAQVRLLPLLELDAVDSDAVRARWRAAGPDPGAVAPLGVTERGRFVLDLVRDGAHGLVGGTTGSGKSELLRSLVAALAVHTDPDHLTFVLVDYKGGAAFDVCSRLPHVVGLVTDLDEQLGERALRALEAELHHRERVLRAAGADNLPEYLALGRPEPLPRLVVVIDEFATMAEELPEFVTSLVGIAQRGRTLGVHLLLATQRPTGAVNDDIRANTNLRIALRVQDAADSVDVVGVRDAADLGRDRPGRAYVRLGPGEVVPIQTALVTCTSASRGGGAVDAAPFVFGPRTREPSADRSAPDDVPRAPTDLQRLVDAVARAYAAEGLAPPRRPWPEPLPPVLPLEQLLDPAAPAHLAVAALSDDPARQRQLPVGWDLSEGGLLLLGVPGSGTTTALLALALSLAERLSPQELQLYALDLGVGDLAVLEGLPHTGAVVQAADRERQVRLLRGLRAELDRRRSLPRGTALPRRVVLVDNLAALRAELDDVEGLELMDALARVHADGPEVGICVALTADRTAVVPGPIASVTTQRWMFRLTDPYEYSSAGLGRTDAPAAVPGRAVLLPSRLQGQVGLPGPGAVARVAARWSAVARSAPPVGVLPSRVPAAALPPARREGEAVLLPVGIAESDLGVAELALYEGDAVLVAGPARSGRSAVLAAMAATLRAGLPELHLVATGGRRSPLARCGALDLWVPAAEVGAAVGGLRTARPTVLLVDDAEGFDDADLALDGLVAAGPPGLHVVAAARTEALRSLYGHWTQKVRRSRTGLLLRPSLDLDGDLLGVALPRRTPVALTTARGYLVDAGEARLVQAATPDDPA